MENQLFCKLYAHSSYKLEDFATEVLAGILSSNPSLLDKFVNKILNIQGKNFTVETQKIYGNTQVDMILSNADSLCFLQCKVESYLTTTQLEELKNILNGQSESLNVYLRYCTQSYANKVIKGINFDQCRWEDIYNYLQTYSDNPLIKEFIDFLKENNMDTLEELASAELTAISQLTATIKKMDRCLDSVADEFTELFDSPVIGASSQAQERLQDLVKFNQYHMTKAPLLHGETGEWGWSDVRISFNYSEEVATLVVWFWCGNTHAQYALLKKYFEHYRQLLSASADLVVHDEPNWFIIAFEKPLADFDATAKPLQAIHNWFVEHMRLLRQFADKTPELNWNFPPQ